MIGLAALAAAAQISPGAFPPGFIDPAPVLAAARQAIGVDRIRCLTAKGNAYGGRLGQQRYVKVEGDWPIDNLRDFSRHMNWDARAMREEFDRTPGQTPASYKYGAGWTGSRPTQKHSRQIFAVNGATAWHRDGPDGAVGRIPADIAEMWRLDLWLNPVGFLKAAAMPGANPVAAWRWEIGEAGRDGPVTTPEKVKIVSITMGKYRIDATINARNLIQRVRTRVAHPVLGDLNVEHEFTDDAYTDLGGGMRFPTTWHSHQGYDDNHNTQTVSSGHNAFGGTLGDIDVNQCDPVAVPAALPALADPTRIATEELADGVFLIGGATHNSVAIGMADHVVVVEAPVSEERSLAVIEEVVRLFPDKPIRYLVNTHQHFDAIGGLRTYAHIGATVITHQRNRDFYNRDVLNYTPRLMKPDLVSIMPPTELTEGYTFELVSQNHVLTDGRRTIRINYVQPLEHAEGMLMVTLPKERLLIQADLLNTHEGLPSTPDDGAGTLHAMVKALGYSIDRIVPVHGRPVSWREFLDATGVARPASARPLDLASPIALLAADPRAKAVLDTRIPGLTTHPDYESFKDSTLTELAPVSQGRISDDRLRLVAADLAGLAR